MLPPLKPNYDPKDKNISANLLNALTALLEKTEALFPLMLTRNPDGSWILYIDQDPSDTTTGLTSTDLSTDLSTGLSSGITGTVTGTVTATGTGTTPPTCTPSITFSNWTFTVVFEDCTTQSATIDICSLIAACQ